MMTSEWRIIETTSKDGNPYYALVAWGECNCPDCKEPGHWMQHAGSPDRDFIEKMMKQRTGG